MGMKKSMIVHSISIMQSLKIIKIISQILKCKWGKTLNFIYANIYGCYDYKHAKVCTRENKGWECTKMVIEVIFVWWDHKFLFFQISCNVLNSIYYFKKFLFLKTYRILGYYYSLDQTVQTLQFLIIFEHTKIAIYGSA